MSKPGTHFSTELKPDISQAVHDRGFSFIEAAKLMAKHAELDHQAKQELSNYIQAVEQIWRAKGSTSLKHSDLAVLESFLIDTLRKGIYQDKKGWKKVKDELDNAENHVNWKVREALESEAGSEKNSVSRMEIPIAGFTSAQETEWAKILDPAKAPQWFTALAPWEQNYFKDKVDKWQKTTPEVNLGEYLGSVPTTIRRYPGSPNAYHTVAKATGREGEISFYKIRSGALAPVKMKAGSKAQKAQKVEIARQNLEQLLAVAIKIKLDTLQPRDNIIQIPVLLQTLYSPPLQPPGAYNNEALAEAIEQMRAQLKDPEKLQAFLDRNDIRTIYTLDINLLSSNRPVNKVRGISELLSKSGIIGRENANTHDQIAKHLGATEKVSKDSQLAVEAFAQFQKIDKELGLLSAVKLILKGSPDNPLAERAAYEQIMMDKMGGVRIGTCVSGKDREEMVTEIALAQLQFHSKHGHFPPPFNKNEPDNKERIEFERMVADLYLKGHGQKLAAENSKGCDGLKNVADVFGKRICEQIRDRAPEYGLPKTFDPVKDVQRVAGLNKLNESKLGKIKATDLFKNFVKAIKSALNIKTQKSEMKKDVHAMPLAFAYATHKEQPKKKEQSEKVEKTQRNVDRPKF